MFVFTWHYVFSTRGIWNRLQPVWVSRHEYTSRNVKNKTGIPNLILLSRHSITKCMWWSVHTWANAAWETPIFVVDGIQGRYLFVQRVGINCFLPCQLDIWFWTASQVLCCCFHVFPVRIRCFYSHSRAFSCAPKMCLCPFNWSDGPCFQWLHLQYFFLVCFHGFVQVLLGKVK